MLLNNSKDIYRRISHSAMRAGRSPKKVRLIAVTKGFDIRAIREAVDIGLRDFGESRVQEAQQKITDQVLQDSGSIIRWHLIGHLQKNKAKTAVSLFDLIHSVDSYELLEILDRHAAEAGKKQKVLLQVKLSGEESKYGMEPGELLGVLEKAGGLRHVSIEGLMTIPPYCEDPGAARPFFRELKGLSDRARAEGYDLPELSMGMSHDFEVAIEEGATMVRVGTAIFGDRYVKEAS